MIGADNCADDSANGALVPVGMEEAYSRPALKLRRRPINAPKRGGNSALRRREP